MSMSLAGQMNIHLHVHTLNNTKVAIIQKRKLFYLMPMEKCIIYMGYSLLQSTLAYS